jgi:hypothetical protein
MRALRPEPAERFASIAQFLKALEEPRPRRVWPWLLSAVALVGGALALMPEDAGPVEVPGEWRDAAAGTRIWEDVLCGDWQNENGVLTSGPNICVVKLEDDLPESYDVRIRVTRLQGQYSTALFFRSGGRLGSVELDAWKEGLAGVQVINGQDLRSGYGFRFPLVNGETHELFVEVRPDEVRVSVDGVLQKTFVTRGMPLAITPVWELGPTPRPMALGLGSYLSPTRFEQVEWRPVDGAAKN